MKKIPQFILAGAFAFLAGCAGVKSAAQQDKERFCRISDELDSGGSCYFIGTPAHLKKSAEQLFRKTEKSLWQMNVPEERKRHIQSVISGLELFSVSGGLNELSGWGGSSVLSDKEEKLFRNRLILLSEAPPQGFLWDIAVNNPALLPQIGKLPEDTVWAAAADLNLRDIAEVLKSVPGLQQKTDRYARFFTGMSSCDLLKKLSGIWLAALITDDEYSAATWYGIHLKLQIPAPKDAAFRERIKVWGRAFNNSGEDLKSGIIRLAPIPGSALVPLIIYQESGVTFYSSPEAWLRFSNPGKKLEDIPQFKRRKALLSSSPAAVFYNKNVPVRSAGGVLSAEPDAVFSLGVVEKCRNGFFFEGYSGCDWNEYIVNCAGSFQFHSLIDRFFPAGKTPPPPGQVKKQPPPSNKKTAPKTSASAVEKECLAHLKNLSGILQKNIAALKGSGIQVFRKLIKEKLIKKEMLCCPAGKIGKKSSDENLSFANCSYLFFGVPEEKSPKSPLLLEIPFNHEGHLGIIHADGSCSLLKTPPTTNIRRTISILQTRYNYEEQEFFRLMKLAEEFDKILEL